MVYVAEWLRRKFVALVYAGSNPVVHPIMIVEVNHRTYGKTELNIDRIIAICPEKKWILFEEVFWPLYEDDFNKVADEWRKRFKD